MFTKIRIYCKNKCCFDDILKSQQPYEIINTDQISSLEPKETWGVCHGNENYPFRRLNMANGDLFLCVLESANELEDLLIEDKNKEAKKVYAFYTVMMNGTVTMSKDISAFATRELAEQTRLDVIKANEKYTDDNPVPYTIYCTDVQEVNLYEKKEDIPFYWDKEG